VNKGTPARRPGWAGVFVLAGVMANIVSAGAADVCKLSLTGVCKKFGPGLQHVCAYHLQLAVALCRKAARQERFGSHEDHCRVACRAGKQAFVLDGQLREFAIATVEQSTSGDKTWRRDVLAFWQATGEPQAVCSAEQFEQAQVECDRHCTVTAKRRDLEELQALAVGKEFLELQLPVFACPPGPATQLLSGNSSKLRERLYAPYDARRSGDAAE